MYYGMRKNVHYGNAVKIRNRPIDLRCEGAYAVCDWSRNAEGKFYEWLGDVLPVNELPLLRVSWLREKSPVRRVKPVAELIGDEIMVRRARAYLATVEGGVSGQKGHFRCFRAACILVQKFGLSYEQAWPIFVEWSERACEPPFSEKELQHKLLDAVKLRKS